MSSTVYTGEQARAYYVEEATYGTTPTNPTMLCIGVIQEIEPALDPKNILLRGIGSRNVKAIRKGLRHIDLKVVYTPQNWNFFNYTRLLKSTSVEVYYEKTSGIVSLNHKGCKVDKAKVDVSIEDPVKVAMDLIGQDVAVSTAQDWSQLRNRALNESFDRQRLFYKQGWSGNHAFQRLQL